MVPNKKIVARILERDGDSIIHEPTGLTAAPVVAELTDGNVVFDLYYEPTTDTLFEFGTPEPVAPVVTPEPDPVVAEPVVETPVSE